jgi:hypothetical protein
MIAGESGPMEGVVGVYIGILRMTLLLPFTFWRAWEITKSRDCGDRDGGDNIAIGHWRTLQDLVKR